MDTSAAAKGRNSAGDSMNKLDILMLTSGIWVILMVWLGAEGFTLDVATIVTAIIAVIGFLLHLNEKLGGVTATASSTMSMVATLNQRLERMEARIDDLYERK